MADKVGYHHRNYSRGALRNGAPANDADVSTSGECFTHQMNDEDYEQFMALLNRKRFYNGVKYTDNPYTQSEGDETPHGTV